MSALLGRARRLPAVARDGWNYPARRLQASAVDAHEGLLRLRLDPDGIDQLEQEFEAAAPALYDQLAGTARSARAKEAEERATHPTASSTEAKKVLYVTVRALRPDVVVETGVFNGAASTFLLAALEQNGSGQLLSFDLPDARDALGVRLPQGLEPGWLVPSHLRHRFELVLGDIRETLRPRLAVCGGVDVFLHDSLHTLPHMLFEYRAAWQYLKAGGVLISDDVAWNPAFWLFTKWHRTPVAQIASLGLTRKLA
jgi:predicted O-methyltransferase YrrM